MEATKEVALGGEEAVWVVVVLEMETLGAQCVVLRGLLGCDSAEAVLRHPHACGFTTTALHSAVRALRLCAPDRPHENERRIYAAIGRPLCGDPLPSLLSRLATLARRACWLVCCPPLPTPIIYKLIFVPPTQPNYVFTAPDGTIVGPANVKRLAETPDCRYAFSFCPLHMNDPMTSPLELDQFHGFLAKTSRGGVVAGAWLPCDGAPFTFLYSHPNANDLASTAGTAFDMRNRLGCSVLIYDYPGYGLSSGKATERSFYASAEDVLAFAVHELAVPVQRIIAYGFSLGSAAAAHMAMHESRLAALVLSGAFVSAINVIRSIPAASCRPIDKFCTYERLEGIRVPTLVIHSFDDVVTRLEHGLWILERCVYPLQPLFIAKASHDDVGGFVHPLWTRLRRLIVDDLGGPQPHAALRAVLATALPNMLPGVEEACCSGSKGCRACVGAVVAALPSIGFHVRPDCRVDQMGVELQPMPPSDDGWSALWQLVLWSGASSGVEVRASVKTGVPYPTQVAKPKAAAFAFLQPDEGPSPQFQWLSEDCTDDTCPLDLKSDASN